MESCGDILALPENCIANVLSLTTPKDVCRLALVASTFRSASQSDSVWESFLPSGYRDILERAVGGSDSPLDNIHSKKDLYLYLCNHPILIDGGRKSFSLDIRTRKKRYMLAARELSIVWSESPEYWQWISLPESRFSEVAQLLDVCWLEIQGSINTNMLSPGTNYAAYLVFTCRSRTYGFDNPPAEASVGLSGNEAGKRMVCLEPRDEGLYLLRWHPIRTRSYNSHEYIECPKRRADGWMEVELGEYFVEGGEENGALVMRLMEVKGGRWKSGLIVQGVEIRPKD